MVQGLSIGLRMVRCTIWYCLCTRPVDCSGQSTPTSTLRGLHLGEDEWGKEGLLTQNVGGAVGCKLVDDSFIPETRLEFETIQETIAEQTTNIREDGKNNNRPPRPPVERQALRQTIVKSQERAFHRPRTREEDIRKAPLGFRILSCYLFPIRRFRLVEILDALEDPGVVSFGAFKDVGCEEEDEGEDDEVVVNF